MKKLALTILMIIFTFIAISQVYMPPESFDGDFPPAGWTIENGGATSTFEQGPMPTTLEPMCTWIQTLPNMIVDDRIISPEIIIPTGAEPKLYAQLRGSVGYALAMYWDPDNEVRYFIEVSTDGGATWTSVLDLDDQASVIAAGTSWPWADWSWFDVSIDISAYAGETIQIAFHHEKEYLPSGGGGFGITNIGIWEDIENDVQLISLQMPDYSVVNNAVEIEGVFKNIGSNLVTSFEGEYKINGEVSETFAISGISIAQFDSYTFTAGNPALFSTVDIFEVELVITKVNGMDDGSPENNLLTHEISIASETVTRKPLFEMFTSSTCSPCSQANETLDGVLYANPDSTYSLVKYQVSWPGSGDPYYIEDCGIRIDYYNVMSVPSLITNGNKLFSASNFTQANFDQASGEEAYVEMTMEHTFDGLNVTASVTVNPKINIEDASVHIAVVEKTTYNNTGSNGETEFHNVLMDMIPDANGTSIGLQAGVSDSYSGSSNLITTFIEEFDDLMLVSWVQDNHTKSILQSESYNLNIVTGINNKKDINTYIFPNPGNGIFMIQGASNSDIEVSDVTGKTVYKESSFEGNHTIDLSDFENGIYFVRIIRGETVVAIEKLIIK
jgi:hypothetical protein